MSRPAAALGGYKLVSAKKFRKFADDESSGDNDDIIKKAANIFPSRHVKGVYGHDEHSLA